MASGKRQMSVAPFSPQKSDFSVLLETVYCLYLSLRHNPTVVPVTEAAYLRANKRYEHFQE